jgi:membrane-associated phospholipid phosphatase
MEPVIRRASAAAVTILLSAATAAAQTPPSPGAESAAAAAPVVAAPAQLPAERGGASRFFIDVAHDYPNFLSVENAIWIGVGGGVALATHPADDDVRDYFAAPEPTTFTTSLNGGAEYGSLLVQVPLAIGWWMVGHAAGSNREADAGRDLLRGQISAVSWTYALKYSVNRERPNGDPRSFPSGHASAVFSTAAVLSQHYGLKLGVPAYALATYTATSRLSDNKHWLSDTVFGAVLGATSGRTVTLHLRRERVTLAPLAVPGGAGVLLVTSRVT